ncbi:protein-L-isoaspartate O-methyltransferase [Conchiformibius steedae DSM 2580]|uniref:Protein-L-isoaspartate O-methyltransferase n=2 Tax=Conchiformibius steedae TaxID=153493 RepID=A0A3P2A8Q4_9NEIS|nr:protein-L-isoaspartate O-methyltransferase [Conchiformibius steedae]QMT32960.1 protein-L-isoaspartate O-methyltransferase [Conchiformibius steedae]RRD91751.1 protein-L-isoaspartate O-methyltransferase [Conchiformibius steedae]URD67582.1 protein-L-isoaspartate O-methyltransferase [Conchiformibius steedae DSM 2580]
MDFEQARFNMVEQQIRPWNVLDFDVLDAVSDIPREAFVMENQRGYAYADMPLVLPNGGYMLEPKIIARMVQGLALKKTDQVLEVGTGSGYATALLASLAAQVQTFDTDNTQLQTAKAVLDRLDFHNIRYEHGDGFAEQHSHNRYDAVYIGGGLPVVPENLKARLNDGGRMVVVAGKAPVQHCLLITRHGDEFSQTVLFDTLVTGLDAKAVPANGSRFKF